MKRAAGVLVNVSSLPSDFAIGNFSEKSRDVLKAIRSMGFSWWQILPLNTIGGGDSPYSGASTFAGNALYIDPYALRQQGLITEAELETAKTTDHPYSVNYNQARRTTCLLLQKANQRLTPIIREEMLNFYEQQKFWLKDYTLFMALSEKYSPRWWEWPSALKAHDPNALQEIADELACEIEYYTFEQYEFFKQWNELKSFANKIGLQVFGDLPFYVALDSVDVWSHQDLFQLDQDGKPTGVSGVPPDYFAKDGQIWGNPLFNFEEMKKDEYAWWRQRVKHALSLYDGLRLDHFRAFAEYFSIPNNIPLLAKDGKWQKGPGQDLIKHLKEDNAGKYIVAEDLGIIDKKVTSLVKWSNFSTMKVMHFAFDSENSVHLPHKYQNKDVGYTGTHDNNTTLGWLYQTSDQRREYCFKYCGYDGHNWGEGGRNCPSTKAIMRTLFASVADLVFVPIQDLTSYGEDTRMNMPGRAEGNWTFKMTTQTLNDIDRSYFLELNKLYGREI